MSGAGDAMAGDTPDLSPAVSPALLYSALAAALLGASISLAHIVLHLKHFHEPAQQRYITRILFIVPIYAIGSWLSLRSPSAALYFALFRDSYEAYVVYCFLALVLVYAGGDSTCVHRMREKGLMRHPWPLCCLPPLLLTGRFLRACKQGALQFVFVKPIMAVLSLVMLLVDQYDSTAYQVIQLFVYNLSYSIALYALLLFYMATRELLAPFRPVLKFFAVKLVIFATYWQSLVVAIIPGTTTDSATAWNNFILCIEMFFFALLHCCAFSYTQTEIREGQVHTTILQNARHVISQKDVVTDAYHNFMPSYQDYVLHKPYAEAAPKTYRARTFIFGNLDQVQSSSQAILADDGNARQSYQEIDLSFALQDVEHASDHQDHDEPIVADRSP